MPDHPRVFCSHRSVDKARVQAIAEQLEAAGIDSWWDGWEINPGDNYVARLDEGLHTCAAGLIFLSRDTLDSNWVQHEISTLIHKAVEDGILLFPVRLDPDMPLPALLRSYSRLGATQTDALIAGHLHCLHATDQLFPEQERLMRELGQELSPED